VLKVRPPLYLFFGKSILKTLLAYWPYYDTKIAFFLDIMLFNLVDKYRLFGCVGCLHLHVTRCLYAIIRHLPLLLHVTGNNYNFFLWRCDPTRVMASPILRFLDHTQRRTTVGRTPLDEWSDRRRDLYLTTLTIDKYPMPPVRFEPTISAGERLQTYTLDRTAPGTGNKYELEYNIA
jgi:hypothetical protein